ncbi:MAG TPA: hypothetical protein VFT06_00335 [Flavisolibacter sp.]|nr:hypothetical protein [Flavisolibacter sp.]
MNVNVYKVELLIIDFDRIGGACIKDELENANYANDCISPNVMLIERREVEWTDEHPLNGCDKMKDAYQQLFK